MRFGAFVLRWPYEHQPVGRLPSVSRTVCLALFSGARLTRSTRETPGGTVRVFAKTEEALCGDDDQ